MEMWQMVLGVIGGVVFLMYFKRRAARLSQED